MPAKRAAIFVLLLVKVAAAFALAAALAIVAARLVFPLPDISSRAAGSAIPADPATTLGALMVEAGDRSGVVALREGRDALASRLALTAAAQRSIDAQYYIWHDDTSGIMLLDELRKAAARGVRVRLLLDDNGVPGLDDVMAALNALDNFEIRLFNPSTVRHPKLLGYAFDFMRMNRRMHNKSFTVDGAATIVGGRNIGDEYFQVGSDAFYVDLDVLAAGAIVPQTAALFDDYWNSASVFEVEKIVSGQGDLAAFRARVAEVAASQEARDLLEGFRNSADRYLKHVADIEWTNVQLVADDPVKGLGIATRDQLMVARLGEILGEVGERLDLVSAYFVPGKTGTDYVSGLARAGRQVRILTNALNTTDVLVVHAGYTKYRRRLLEAGIGLYEMKLRASGGSEADMQLNPFGLSGASLHAKTFAVDRKRIFIGSFNFDPRSAILNCEMGFLIDSAKLAQDVSAAFDGPIAAVSYRPELTPEDKMVWLETAADGRTVVYQEEPGATWFQQAAIAVIGLLPIEWLL